MRRRAFFLLLVGFLLVPHGALAQNDEQWTCDGGPNDALNAAQAAYDAGEFDRAYELATVAEEVCRSSATADSARYHQVLNLLVQIEIQQGLLPPSMGEDIQETAEVETEVLSALEGLEFMGVETSQASTVDSLLQIGETYYAQGQYAQALECYTLALKFQREINDRAGEGRTLNDIGLVTADQRQYTQALDAYQQALDITRELGDRAEEGAILNNMGLVYEARGQNDRAFDLFNQALNIHREVGNAAGEGAALANIGQLYYDQHQDIQALDTDRQALYLARELGDLKQEGAILTSMGMAYADRGEHVQALDFYIQALDIQSAISDRAGGITTLVMRGRTYEAMGQIAEAIADYQTAVELGEALLNDAALDKAITGLAGQWQHSTPYQRLAVLLVRQGDLESALLCAERGRAVLSRTDLTTGQIDFRAGLDKTLLEEEIDLRLTLGDSQTRLDNLRRDTSAAAADVQNAQSALSSARQAYENHLAMMQLQGGFLARQISREVATLAQIQAALPADTTLVLYAVGSPDSVVFLITADSLDAVVLEVTDSAMAEQVITFASDRRADTPVLSTLYGLIMAPIADRLTTSRLIVVPDGALNYIPFAALQSPGGRYLVDDYSISTVSSATILVMLHDRTPVEPTSPGLVLSQPAAPGLPTLRNAPLEALNIANLLGVEPNLDASEADLSQGAPGSAVVYIAAHAQLDRFAPLYSTIYLGASGNYDGRLEVREIYELDLSQGTELVVLSGCETASGGDGEDFGLITRAFFAAGTPRVVASLWSVDDRATTDLLTSYIAARAEYPNDADALRAAMLATREQYAEPYFWAGFVLSGLPE
jgi:CHAT domain-containing protein